MYRKKIAVTCLYNPINNSITSLQFTTNNHVKINATLPHDNFTSYNTIQDLIEQIRNQIAGQTSQPVPDYMSSIMSRIKDGNFNMD